MTSPIPPKLKLIVQPVVGKISLKGGYAVPPCSSSPSEVERALRALFTSAHPNTRLRLREEFLPDSNVGDIGSDARDATLPHWSRLRAEGQITFTLSRAYDPVQRRTVVTEAITFRPGETMDVNLPTAAKLLTGSVSGYMLEEVGIEVAPARGTISRREGERDLLTSIARARGEDAQREAALRAENEKLQAELAALRAGVALPQPPAAQGPGGDVGELVDEQPLGADVAQPEPAAEPAPSKPSGLPKPRR